MVTDLVEVLKLGLPVELGVLNPFIYDQMDAHPNANLSFPLLS